jgi:hypothetical protein
MPLSHDFPMVEMVVDRFVIDHLRAYPWLNFTEARSAETRSNHVCSDLD